jgi:nitrile hydratase subunit alpha
MNSRPSDTARSDASNSTSNFTSTSTFGAVSGGPAADVVARAKALRDALITRSLVTAEALDEVVHEFTDVLTPRNGAIVVARCWVDPAFRVRFLADATAASAELGIAGPEGKHMRAVENTDALHNVIVCTQCSCTAWPLIGLPPDWYKSAPYRSRVVREARNVLEEMGLSIPVETEIRVWDTTGDTRYVVFPLRPPDTQSWSEDQLRELITRECLIGVAVPQVTSE